MIKSTAPACMMATAFALSACSTTGSPPVSPTTAPSRESITYSVGPCFGFCPVYTAAVSALGKVSYDGKRHTTVLGMRNREAGSTAYSKVAAALAPFRPVSGTSTKTTCDVESSDGSSYQVVWTTADGQKTVLDHDHGCQSEGNRRLNAVLQRLPEMMGIAAWSQQVTRAGASRG